MKKFLAALLIGAFGINAIAQTTREFDPAADPSVVYDYKATFKRVDPQYKIRSLDSQKKVVESYAVKSDSITGYIILPVCSDCVTENDFAITSSFEGDQFNGVGYFVRKDNKLIKNADIAWVAKVPVEAQAGIFGKNAYVIDTDQNQYPFAQNEYYTVKNLNSAWMALSFDVPDKVDYSTSGFEGDLFIKNITTDPDNDEDNISVGFLGLDHGTDFERATLYNKGFGTVKTVGQSDAYSMGLCGSTTTLGWNCSIIQSISGSMGAQYKIEGTCSVTPMWDLCNPDQNSVHSSVLAGTWSLKYNKTLTEVVPADKEDAILAKLRATIADVMDITVVAPGAR